MQARIRNTLACVLLFILAPSAPGETFDRPLLSGPLTELSVEVSLVEETVRKGEPLVFFVRIVNRGSTAVSVDKKLFALNRGNIRFSFFDDAPAGSAPVDGYAPKLVAFESHPRVLLQPGEYCDDLVLLWGSSGPFTSRPFRNFVSVSGSVYGLANGEPYQASFKKERIPFYVAGEIEGYQAALSLPAEAINNLYVDDDSHGQFTDYLNKYPQSVLAPYLRLILADVKSPRNARTQIYEEIAVDRSAPLGARRLADAALTVLRSKSRRAYPER